MQAQFWTLVQHSGHTTPGFQHAVEIAAVTREGMVDNRKPLAARIFTSYLDATLTADSENYPPEVTGLHPHCRGAFVGVVLDRRKLYIPSAVALVTPDDPAALTWAGP